MEFTIGEKKAESLLSRTSVSGQVVFEGATPSNADVRKAIAAATKAKESMIVIRKIGMQFGSQKAAVQARIYDDEKSMKFIENIKEKKDAPADGEAPKAEENKAPAAEKKDAPAKKDAPKAEDKKDPKAEEKK